MRGPDSERTAFVREAMARIIGVDPRPDDDALVIGCLLFELYLVEPEKERERIFLGAPEGLRARFEELALRVEQRFPEGRPL